ncbi:YlbD family protein [Oceanobacillus damuensis]|uniref:YlbD family protein n=1 Tax=Oceanobacillus damuensis TaxID=937928 RepID=UPI001F3AC876|nr:YlbD family protein [Oceanobacillus damuensis]
MKKLEELHPTLIAFKEFINKHPLLLREIRKSGRSWQEYYEQWILLGEDDPHWDNYKGEPSTDHSQNTDKTVGKDSELMSQLLKYTSNLDINKMQGQVNQLSKAIAAIQDMMEQFKGSQKKEQPPKDPFSWVRD